MCSLCFQNKALIVQVYDSEMKIKFNLSKDTK